MDRGSSFHSRGAATTKDLSPHECLDLGSINISEQTIDSVLTTYTEL